MDFPVSFTEKMKTILGDEYDDFLKGYDRTRHYGLRVNRTKLSTEQFEKMCTYELEPVPWIDNAFEYEDSVSPAKHPYYFAGMYYLQEPSAMTPANLLPVEPGDRVLDLLSEKPAVEPVTNGEKFSFESLSVSDLSFSYDGETQVLSDICMHAEKGEIIGIVGESGCGKSTLLKLLLRFWQKNKGGICYNGIDIDKIDEASLLDNVTMVSQVTYLFDETIEDNIRIAKPNATQTEIEEACRMASVHDFIMSLSDGYKTCVGALGDNLSAGEKQRLGLARAFLRGSDLILLDEPTSNVDSINEGIILKALKKQKQSKSIILVSHRESTMAVADRVYRVEGGRIYECC